MLVFVKEKYLDSADVWLTKNACDVGNRDKCVGKMFDCELIIHFKDLTCLCSSVIYCNELFFME